MKKLYTELLPALSSKEKSLHNEGFVLITKKDIFNYFSNKWDKYSELSDIVDDIMNADGIKISNTLDDEKIYRRSLYEEK